MAGASTHLSRDQLVAAGRDALLSGDHARARELLDTAVRLYPADAEIWLWLSGTEDDPREMAACLHRALQLDPDSQQARDGLRWIAETYGAEMARPPDGQAAHPAGRIAAGAGLLEAVVNPFVAGALLGLTRLVGWLRAPTLAALRTDDVALGFGDALLPASLAAIGHGVALLAAAIALGVVLSALRRRGRGDVFDSFLRTGGVFEPGLLWGVGLGLAAFGLVFAPLVWPAVAVLCWTVLAAGTVLIALRLLHLATALGVVSPAHRLLLAAVPLLVALLGCALAGLAAAATL